MYYNNFRMDEDVKFFKIFFKNLDYFFVQKERICQ